jgi:hypothetical protein
MPPALGTNYLMGVREMVGTFLTQVPGSILGAFFFFGILVGLRSLLRNPWLVGAAFVALWVALKLLSSQHPWVELPTQVLIYSIAAFACVRFGLLTLAAAVFVADILLNCPVSFDFSRWYAATTIWVPLAILAIAAWSFRSALAGRKLGTADSAHGN